MIIPPIRWSDILLREEGLRYPPLLESQQYLLQMLLSLVQMNPAQFLADWNEADSFDINDFLDSCMSALLDDNTLIKQLFQPFLYVPDQWVSVTGNPITFISDTTFFRAGYFRQSAPALNDEVRFFNQYFPTGTYQIRCLHQKTSSGGIVSFQIDGTTVDTMDTYNASTLKNQYYTSGSFDIDEGDGGLQFSYQVTSKHASSANYFADIGWIMLVRTGD